MTVQEKLDTLKATEARAFAELADTSPNEPTFNYILNNIGLLRQITEAVKYAGDDFFAANAEAETAAGEESACTAPAKKEPAHTASAPTKAEPKEAPHMTLEEVRGKLVAYARAGVDLAALLQQMGYTKLSEVPASSYEELLAGAEAAADGVA